ncbi:MAG: hypothetical protein JSV82_07100 [Planctomycetota bacterium]|nr:MAG: hypothetical protein JSV82_07100 [Planctomycetota bacterium]
MRGALLSASHFYINYDGLVLPDISVSSIEQTKKTAIRVKLSEDPGEN